MKLTRWAGVVVTLLSVAAYSDIHPTVEDGGTVVTPKGYNFATEDINEGSSLRRSWVTLNDTECPLEIVEVTFPVKGRSGDFFIRAAGHMRPREPISAFEIRILLFDVFGNHLRSLTATMVKDYDAGDEVPLTGRWTMGWTDVEELLTAVVYVANVRTQEGVVWQYSEEAIAKSYLQLDLAGTLSKEVKEVLE